MTITDYDTDKIALASARAHIALSSAGELVEHVLAHRLPGRGVGDGQPGVPLESRTAAIPGNTTAVDDADAIYAELTKWVQFWADRLSITTLRLRIRGQWVTGNGKPLGFTADVDPGDARTAVRDVAQWLLTEHDRIGRNVGGFEYFEDVARLIETISSRFPSNVRPERPAWGRPCPFCLRVGTVVAEWQPDADVRDVKVWCLPQPLGCGTVLVSTSADGDIRPSDRLPRSRDHVNPGEILPARKLVSVVRQIATGTTVPRIEEPEGATARVEGEAVHCDLPKGHDGRHRDFIEDARWGA